MTETATRPIVMSFLQTTGWELLPTDSWDFVQPKHLKWIHRLCVWFLKKCGGLRQHFDERAIVKQFVIDPTEAAPKIVDMAWAQLRAMGCRPTRVLVGNPQFEQIIGMANFGRNRFTFDLQLPERCERTRESYSGWETDVTYCGVRIEVIPWMDGVLVL